MDFDKLLEHATRQGASDIHLQSGSRPMQRVAGMLEPAANEQLTDVDLRGWIRKIAPSGPGADLDSTLADGLDFSHAVAGLGRFRCSAYRQQGRVGLTLRVIRTTIPTPAELHLPGIVRDLALVRRGLTLIAGTSGSGRSTALAALVQLINADHAVKITTIEAPVEYIYPAGKALVAQLEVGRDSPSLQHGAELALRQNTDVLVLSELRDADTLRLALRAVDAGHQVFAVMHSADAIQSIERIMAMFPAGEHNLLLEQLAATLEGIVALRLLTTTGGEPWPAVEILRGNAITQRFILEGRLGELSDYMRLGESGIQTFDQHLIELYNQGLISGTEALRAATRPEALSLRMLDIRTRDPRPPGG